MNHMSFDEFWPGRRPGQNGLSGHSGQKPREMASLAALNGTKCLKWHESAILAPESALFDAKSALLVISRLAARNHVSVQHPGTVGARFY